MIFNHFLSERGVKMWPNRKGLFVAGLSLVLTMFISAPAVAQAPPCPPQIVDTNGEATVGNGNQCPSSSGFPAPLSQTPDYQDPLASCSSLQTRRVVSVASASALQSAVSNARCGDTIELERGAFGSNLAVEIDCPADNPVIIKGASNFESVATGRWTLTGGRNIISGIKFSGESSGVNCHGSNNKILGNQFTGTSNHAVQLSAEASPAVSCEVAYNEFFSPAAGCFGSGGFKQAIKMNTAGSGQAHTAQTNVWIHHNWFHDWTSDGCKQGDVVEIGESGTYDWLPDTELGTYVEDNLIERYTRTGQAAVDMKVGGNVVRRNTLRDSPNTRLQGRMGTGSIWESNWIESGGLMVNNKNNKVVCNRVSGQSIGVQAGTQEPTELENGYARSVDTLVSGNDGALVVGHRYSNEHNLAAMNTVIENHTGSISFDLHAGTVANSVNSSSYLCPAAVELSPSQVGPAAMDSAPASYLRCRKP